MEPQRSIFVGGTPRKLAFTEDCTLNIASSFPIGHRLRGLFDSSHYPFVFVWAPKSSAICVTNSDYVGFPVHCCGLVRTRLAILSIWRQIVHPFYSVTATWPVAPPPVPVPNAPLPPCSNGRLLLSTTTGHETLAAQLQLPADWSPNPKPSPCHGGRVSVLQGSSELYWLKLSF
ncbi:hypothetical protein CSKR_109889 [Clonorchis sinensis]|uniref:Uncharacterized protein n=1 Tax=Clonorchis sinensis TaxID=79923 RepID=A0A3R7G870_CLOSI|nr:hypothetical protein CSKR_109889 [Clonorchis sinensis]